MLKVFDDPLVLQQKPKVGTAEELLRVPDVAERKILARRRGLKPVLRSVATRHPVSVRCHGCWRLRRCGAGWHVWSRGAPGSPGGSLKLHGGCSIHGQLSG